MTELTDQISSFNKEDIEELFQHNNSSIWKEYDFYKSMDKYRRGILGLFLEVDRAYGSWRFMDRVLPSLFSELYNVLKSTLKTIRNTIEEINYEVWIDNSWDFLSEYKEKQNEISQYYYLFEHLLLKFKKEFVSKNPLSHYFTKATYDRTLRILKIRILNIFYYFHKRSITQCKRKAKESFVKIISSRLENLQLPCLSHKEFIIYDLDLGFCKDKLKDFFKPTYVNREYTLGLKPIWNDEETRISLYYFNHIEDEFYLLSNQENSSISNAIKQSGEQELFQDWFNQDAVKKEIIINFFYRTYFKYLRKKGLNIEDIKKAKTKLIARQKELSDHFGITYEIDEIIKYLRKNWGDRYEATDDDLKKRVFCVLDSIFPPRKRENTIQNIKSNDISELEEIAVIDLETNGEDYFGDAIVEIGICRLNLKTGEIEPLFNEICQEQGKRIEYDSWIFKNSDLDYYKVINAPDLKEFRREIQHILNKYHITSFNQEFDFSFLKQRGLKIRKKFWDPMIKLQYLFKIPRYDGDYKYPSFQESWWRFFPESDYRVKHRALDDAIHEAKIIYEYYKKEKENEVQEE